MTHVLAIMASDGWRLGMGDPTVGGWATLGCYVLGAAACWRAWIVARAGAATSLEWASWERRTRSRSAAYRASIRLWAILACGFALLALNKVTDVRSWAEDLVREAAFGVGLAPSRRMLQAIVIGLIVAATLGVIVAFRRALARVLVRHRLATIGAVLLVSFLLMRAVSYHYLDAALHHAVLGLRLRWVIEIALISTIVLAAIRFARWYGRRATVTSPEREPFVSFVERYL